MSMKKNISIFKKIKIFKIFKNTIKENSIELEQRFNIRIDNAKRLYTVVNIPQEVVGEPYNLRKADIDKISEKFIKEFSTEISKYLDAKGLKELYEFYKLEKVDKYSYLIVFGFSLFKSDKFYNDIYFKLLPSILGLITILYLIFLL